MTPEQDAHWQIFNLVEEIRRRAQCDLIQIIAAVREVSRILEENDVVALLMPEIWHQNEFARRMKYAKTALWKAMTALERQPRGKKK